MLSTPKIVTRPDQPYASIRITVSQPEIAQVAPPLIPEVETWLAGQGLTTAGPCFFNYVGMEPDGKMVMDAGWPTDAVAKAAGKITTGVIPGGRYAQLTWTGPYDKLYEAHMALGDWVHQKGLELDEQQTPGGFADGNRLEIYITDPDTTPDPKDYVTDVLFKLKD